MAGNFPVRRDLQQRIEREAALVQVPMRNREIATGPAPARPEQYVEIEHACAPAASPSAPEAALDRLEVMKQFRWRQNRLEQSGGIGELSVRGPDRRGFDDPGCRDRLNLVERRTQHGEGRAISAMWSVGPQADHIEVGHPARAASI